MAVVGEQELRMDTLDQRHDATSLQSPKVIAVWTVVISALVSLASIRGLVDPSVYEEETKNWATQAKGQDIGNLLAVATLLLSGYGYAKGSRLAALIWLGTLLYLIYAYVVYAMAVHFNELFLVYVAVLGLASYAAMFTVSHLRAGIEVLPDPTARKVAGYTSIAIGTLFGLLWLAEVVPATLTGEAPQSVVDAGLWVNPIHVIDLAVLLPGFILAGLQTLKGRAGGLFFVGPLLVFSVLMGTSIVAAMVLMTVEGFDNTFPPLVMVSVIVVASLLAALRYLRRTTDTARA